MDDPPGPTQTTLDTTDTATTPTTPPVTSDWTRVDDAPDPSDMRGGMDLVIAPDGTILVSWVDDRTGNKDLRVRRSTDGGLTWEPSIVVDGAEEPIVDFWSGPALLTDGARVALVGPARVDSTVQGFVWTADFASLAFGPGETHGVGLVEMIDGAFDPTGDLWIGWLEYGNGVEVKVANTPLGPEGSVVNGTLGTPSCECCPVDLDFSPSGRPLISWRDNNDNTRNMAVASGPVGATNYSDVVVATQTDWTVFSCPVQGARFGHLASGDTLLTWSDQSSGTAVVYTATSPDAVTWSAERPIPAGSGSNQQSPRVTVSDTGRVFLLHEQDESYWLSTSDDDGATWATASRLSTSQGPIEKAEVVAFQSEIWVGGESADQVWIRRIQ